jgi:SAM-dependent methyltransferase
MTAPHGLIGMLLSIVTSRKMRRLSAINRLVDHIAFKGVSDLKLKKLYAGLLDVLDESSSGWESYDYGEGYFYQSYPNLNISGLRKTELRFADYDEHGIFSSDKTVLDIGCNAGFLSLMVANKTRHVDAFELNPYLIRIAEMCRVFEGIENVRFVCSDFDSFDLADSYDIVISLANHHTFDENMRPDFREYMEKIRSVMPVDGMLLFESHPGEHRTPLPEKADLGLFRFIRDRKRKSCISCEKRVRFEQANHLA